MYDDLSLGTHGAEKQARTTLFNRGNFAENESRRPTGGVGPVGVEGWVLWGLRGGSCGGSCGGWVLWGFCWNRLADEVSGKCSVNISQRQLNAPIRNSTLKQVLKVSQAGVNMCAKSVPSRC